MLRNACAANTAIRDCGWATKTLLAATELFEILIAGVGGHAAMPHLTRDPIVAASAIIMNLQSAVAAADSIATIISQSICWTLTMEGYFAGSDNKGQGKIGPVQWQLSCCPSGGNSGS